MTASLKELSMNYDHLIQRIDELCEPDEPIIIKLQLIDRMITDVNIAVENLSFDILHSKPALNEIEQQEYDDMVTANNVIKQFSPYIMWFNIQQKLANEKLKRNK